MRGWVGLVVVAVLGFGSAGGGDRSAPSSNASASAPHEGHAASASGRTALLGNLGSYHRTITSSAEAQQFFDEGLTLLYGFNHEEAFRSFQRAAALDPNVP